MLDPEDFPHHEYVSNKIASSVQGSEPHSKVPAPGRSDAELPGPVRAGSFLPRQIAGCVLQPSSLPRSPAAALLRARSAAILASAQRHEPHLPHEGKAHLPARCHLLFLPFPQHPFISVLFLGCGVFFVFFFSPPTPPTPPAFSTAAEPPEPPGTAERPGAAAGPGATEPGPREGKGAFKAPVRPEGREGSPQCPGPF